MDFASYPDQIRVSHHFLFHNRLAALTLWKQRMAFGTYHDLLKVCCAGGDSKTAAVICDIASRKVKEHG